MAYKLSLLMTALGYSYRSEALGEHLRESYRPSSSSHTHNAVQIISYCLSYWLITSTMAISN